MSMDEFEYAQEEYESEIASRALREDALEYVLENHFRDIRGEVEQAQANEWLERSSRFLELVNLISQHDREQLRSRVLRRAYGQDGDQQGAHTEVQFFNLASDISKLLESVARPVAGVDNAGAREGQSEIAKYLRDHKYGHRPNGATPALAMYAHQCTIEEEPTWVSDLIGLTRAFREVLFLIADPDKASLEWDLSSHLRTIDAALEKGTRAKLVYCGSRAKRHVFAREPNSSTTPLSSLLASWIADYLTLYSPHIDLGACVECGKVFPRQRRDNAYCSKTCQNRVAYKRRKIFEGNVLQKIEFTPKTMTEKLRGGAWAYHPRLGLGSVESVGRERYGPSVTVRFPQISRTFSGRELFQSDSDPARIEFYLEKDGAALAELL